MLPPHRATLLAGPLRALGTSPHRLGFSNSQSRWPAGRPGAASMLFRRANVGAPGRHWNFAFGAAFSLHIGLSQFPARHPAQQVDVSLSPDPSGLSFAHHCRRNRAVDSELAAPLVSRSRAALLKSFCIVTSELRDTSPWGLHGWPGPALSCRGNDGDAGPTNHAAASASGSGFRLRSRHVGNFG